MSSTGSLSPHLYGCRPQIFMPRLCGCWESEFSSEFLHSRHLSVEPPSQPLMGNFNKSTWGGYKMLQELFKYCFGFVDQIDRVFLDEITLVELIHLEVWLSLPSVSGDSSSLIAFKTEYQMFLPLKSTISSFQVLNHFFEEEPIFSAGFPACWLDRATSQLYTTKMWAKSLQEISSCSISVSLEYSD